jgi:hypothetical protein
MKTVRSIAAMIVVAALAVYVYDFYKRIDRQKARDEAALIREQTDVLRHQAEEVNQQLRNANEQAAALRDEVAGQRHDQEIQKQEQDEHKKQQLIAGYLAEGLQVAASAKTAIAESYMTNMQFPATNQEAGLPAPGQMRGQSLQSLRLSRNGVISLTYDGKTGVDQGLIRLVPDVRAGGGQIGWRCETPSYTNIAAFFPQCTYTAPR